MTVVDLPSVVSLLVTVLLGIITWLVNKATAQLEKLNDAFVEMKTEMAATSQRLDDHDRRITQLEESEIH